MEKALKSALTLRARFEQFYYSMSVSTPLKETGEIFYQKPNLMKWEYKNPQDKTFLYKDDIFSLYIPEEKQLTRSRVPEEAFDNEILAFFLGDKALGDLYLIEDTSFPTNAKGTRQIKLIPREEGDYLHVLLEIDEKTWLLRKAVFIEWAGSKQEFIFSRVRTNVKLSPGTFILKVPSDCEIFDDSDIIRR